MHIHDKMNPLKEFYLYRFDFPNRIKFNDRPECTGANDVEYADSYFNESIESLLSAHRLATKHIGRYHYEVIEMEQLIDDAVAVAKRTQGQRRVSTRNFCKIFHEYRQRFYQLAVFYSPMREMQYLEDTVLLSPLGNLGLIAYERTITEFGGSFHSVVYSNESDLFHRAIFTIGSSTTELKENAERQLCNVVCRMGGFTYS